MLTRDGPREPFIEAERRKMLEAKIIKDAKRIRERFTVVTPVVVEDAPEAHNVFLVVGPQTFCVTKWACDTKEDAEFIQHQLCIALANIVKDLKP